MNMELLHKINECNEVVHDKWHPMPMEPMDCSVLLLEQDTDGPEVRMKGKIHDKFKHRLVIDSEPFKMVQEHGEKAYMSMFMAGLALKADNQLDKYPMKEIAVKNLRPLQDLFFLISCFSKPLQDLCLNLLYVFFSKPLQDLCIRW